VRLDKLIRFIAQFFGWISVLAILFLMLGTSIDVFSRNIFSQPIAGIFEVSELFMVVLVYLGLGWTQIDNAHIKVNLFVDKMPPRINALCQFIAYLAVVIFVLILAYSTTKEAYRSFSIKEFRWGYIEIPIWWAKILLSVGLWFAVLQFIYICLDHLKRFLNVQKNSVRGV
jgi:TRAP-type C4-dicarboxylate transport system permease small subunit